MEEKNKIIGIIAVVFGLFCFTPFLVSDKGKLIINESTCFLAKYFIVITFVNGGLFFVILGIFILRGLLTPYYCVAATEYDKAKTQLFGVVIGIPFWISSTATIFSMSKGIFWKSLWFLALIYILWLFISSIIDLRKARDRRQS